MKKIKDNYLLGDALAYCKGRKTFLVLLAVVGLVFPYFPPLYLGFDPRYTHQIPYFFAYYGIYHLLLLLLISNIAAKRSKVQKLLGEKAILLGCPIELKAMGSASNSYRTTVMVNASMLEKLQQTRLHDKITMVEEEVAMAEPFLQKFVLGSGTSGKFLEKNIPHYHKARKIGEVPVPLGSE